MKRFLGAALLVLSIGTLADAQGARARGILRPNRRAIQVPQGQQGGQQNPRRQQLEQQVRRGLWQVAKRRIGFTDEQMTRLEQTTQRFDQRRRALALEEKAQRVSLRTEILADSSANQATIAASLEKLQEVQRKRLEMQVEEQQEFATFMTPLQRAKFAALQEQVRKRLQELVRARPDSAAAPVQLP